MGGTVALDHELFPKTDGERNASEIGRQKQ